MCTILLKAMGVWLVILVAAMLNGAFREKVLVSVTGANVALPLSGILLAVLVFAVTLALVSFIGSTESNVYILVGLLWVMLTLSFEIFFGHYVEGKSWGKIIMVFNIQKGDLFLLVLIVTAISPWLAAKVRGIF